MTAAAAIRQDETERVMRAARNAGWPHVIVQLDLDRRTITATMSESPLAPVAAIPGDDGWDDEQD